MAPKERNILAQNLERHTETFCLNVDLFQEISEEISTSQWIWPIFEGKWSHNALVIWLHPWNSRIPAHVLKVGILMALQFCNRCIKFNMDDFIWIRMYPLCILHMFIYRYVSNWPLFTWNPSVLCFTSKKKGLFQSTQVKQVKMKLHGLPYMTRGMNPLILG